MKRLSQWEKFEAATTCGRKKPGDRKPEGVSPLPTCNSHLDPFKIDGARCKTTAAMSSDFPWCRSFSSRRHGFMLVLRHSLARVGLKPRSKPGGAALVKYPHAAGGSEGLTSRWNSRSNKRHAGCIQPDIGWCEITRVHPTTPPPGRFVRNKSEFYSTCTRFGAKRPGGFFVFRQTLRPRKGRHFGHACRRRPRKFWTALENRPLNTAGSHARPGSRPASHRCGKARPAGPHD